MESRAKLFGHSVHQMVIVLPLGLLLAAFVFDIIYLMTNNTIFSVVAFWNIAFGVAGGLIAAISGFIDWLAIPENTRAKKVGLWHGIGNVVVLMLFVINWFLRLNNPAHIPGILPFILALMAVGLVAITGWLGGELVERLGVGVDPGANLNAPHSFSGKAADAETYQPRPERPMEREVGR